MQDIVHEELCSAIGPQGADTLSGCVLDYLEGIITDYLEDTSGAFEERDVITSVGMFLTSAGFFSNSGSDADEANGLFFRVINQQDFSNHYVCFRRCRS